MTGHKFILSEEIAMIDQPYIWPISYISNIIEN